MTEIRRETPKILLASASAIRRTLLENAGIMVEAVPAIIDERAVEAPLVGVLPADIAAILAQAKALEVSARHPGALVIGCDQTLSLDDEIFHKPADMDGARRHLLKLSGKTHELNSAVVLARNDEILWSHVGIARMTMRKLEPGYIGRHLAAAGPAVLGSVGAYQIEGPGIQLFDAVEGDLFTIAGLPLLPLLAELRRTGMIDG
ncbi:MAG: Maf-like protein [Rhizobiaceae bacterium]